MNSAERRGWRKAISLGAAIAAISGISGSAAAQCDFCPEDVTNDTAINVNDLLQVLGDWGQSDTSSDIDNSGSVDVNDLLLVLSAWGPCQFEYEEISDNSEAAQIALEMLGEEGALLPDPENVERIEQDLDAIRTELSDLASQGHSPAWVSNQVIVSLVDNPTKEALAELECFNEYYQVVNIDKIFGTIYTYTLAGDVNVPALAGIYTSLDAVDFAEPNGIIGGQNFWVPERQGDGTWIWDVDDGFHDCFDGCDCHNLYLIETTEDGMVELLNFEQQGQPWCEF